jgi:hypothetical protein
MVLPNAMLNQITIFGDEITASCISNPLIGSESSAGCGKPSSALIIEIESNAAMRVSSPSPIGYEALEDVDPIPFSQLPSYNDNRSGRCRWVHIEGGIEIW